MMSKNFLTQQLRDGYSAQAEHFDHTRKKNWPEIEYIKTHFQSISKRKKSPIILELGCGSGRLYPHLQKIFKKFKYIGNDIAPGMITHAQKLHKGNIQDLDKIKNISMRMKTQRIIGDMLQMLQALPDNSVDHIVSIASLQHLMTSQERQLLWIHSYRVLTYGWYMISVNWSYSKWFLHQYRKQQLQTLFKIVFLGKKQERNDLLIPRKHPQRQKNGKIRQRHYHLFTIHELRQLSKISSFVVKQLGYILQDGSFNEKNWQASRNSLLIIKKDIGV